MAWTCLDANRSDLSGTWAGLGLRESASGLPDKTTGEYRDRKRVGQDSRTASGCILFSQLFHSSFGMVGNAQSLGYEAIRPTGTGNLCSPNSCMAGLSIDAEFLSRYTVAFGCVRKIDAGAIGPISPSKQAFTALAFR